MGFGPSAAGTQTDLRPDDERGLQRREHGIGTIVIKNIVLLKIAKKNYREDAKDAKEAKDSAQFKKRNKDFLRDLCAFTVPMFRFRLIQVRML